MPVGKKEMHAIKLVYHNICYLDNYDYDEKRVILKRLNQKVYCEQQAGKNQ